MLAAVWSTVLRHAGFRRWVVAAGPGFQPVMGGGAAAGRAHGGDPYGRRLAQVVGGSVVPAVILPLRRGVVIPEGRSAAAAMMDVLGAGEPSAGTSSGGALVAAVWGEKYDGPGEMVAGRASDHDAIQGPSVERMVNWHLTSAGSPHRAAPS
jgi:hypothetical protein